MEDIRFDNLRMRLGRVEISPGDWLGRQSVPLLRLSLGLVFLGFGLLKFVPDLSPAEDLASATVARLTFGFVAGEASRLFVAGIEFVVLSGGLVLAADTLRRRRPLAGG